MVLKWLITAPHDPGNRAEVRKFHSVGTDTPFEVPRKLHVDAEVHAMAERPTCRGPCPVRLQRLLLLGLTPGVHPTSSRSPLLLMAHR